MLIIFKKNKVCFLTIYKSPTFSRNTVYCKLVGGREKKMTNQSSTGGLGGLRMESRIVFVIVAVGTCKLCWCMYCMHVSVHVHMCDNVHSCTDICSPKLWVRGQWQGHNGVFLSINIYLFSYFCLPLCCLLHIFLFCAEKKTVTRRKTITIMYLHL